MARNEDQSRVSAFKRVISTKQSYSAFVPVLSHNSAGECSLYDSPLSALQDFVTNYFSGECIVEDRRALLSTHRSLIQDHRNQAKRLYSLRFKVKPLKTVLDSSNICRHHPVNGSRTCWDYQSVRSLLGFRIAEQGNAKGLAYVSHGMGKSAL